MLPSIAAQRRRLPGTRESPEPSSQDERTPLPSKPARTTTGAPAVTARPSRFATARTRAAPSCLKNTRRPKPPRCTSAAARPVPTRRCATVRTRPSKTLAGPHPSTAAAWFQRAAVPPRSGKRPATPGGFGRLNGLDVARIDPRGERMQRRASLRAVQSATVRRWIASAAGVVRIRSAVHPVRGAVICAHGTGPMGWRLRP